MRRRAARRSSSAARRASRSRSRPATCSCCRPAPGTAARRRATASPSSAPTRRARRTTTSCASDLTRAELEAARERIAALGPPPQDPVGGEGVGALALTDVVAGSRNPSAPPMQRTQARDRSGRAGLPHLPVVLQTAAAAVAAWYLALLLLPSPRPAFASIAAVICLGATYGQRRREAAELVGGVVHRHRRRQRAARADRHRAAADRARRDARHDRGAAAARRADARQRGGGLRDPARLAAAGRARVLGSTASSRA